VQGGGPVKDHPLTRARERMAQHADEISDAQSRVANLVAAAECFDDSLMAVRALLATAVTIGSKAPSGIGRQEFMALAADAFDDLAHRVLLQRTPSGEVH